MPLRPERASSITTAEPRWLWQHRLAFPGVNVIQGDGGLGKGLVTTWVAARLSRGDVPGSISHPANSLIISVEDEREVVRARLRAAGADLDRVDIDGGSELDLLSDLDDLIAYLRRRRIRLLVLDPLHTIARSVSYDVRRALLRITQTLDVSVIAINHLNGNRGADARGRGLGGRALQNLSRATHVLVPHPDDGDANDGLRILAPVKLNRGDKPRSLAGRVTVIDGQPVWDWLGETDYTADDLLVRRRTQPRPTPRLDDAVALLRGILRNGATVPAREVERRAVEAGIAMMTLRDAREALGIEPRRVGFGPGSHFVWALQRDVVGGADTQPGPSARSPSSERPSSSSPSSPPRPAEPTTPPSGPGPSTDPPPPSIDAHPNDVSTNDRPDDAATRFSLLELD